MLWSENSDIKFGTDVVFGVIALNNLSNQDFCTNLKHFIVNFMTSINKKYDKYDIDNAIFSRLQNNELLNKNKYELINKLREKMWLNADKNITEIELNYLFKLL